MHEDEGFDDTNPGGEEQTKPLKQPKAVKLQLFRSPSGSRVRLETKKFDSPSDKVPHSESKPEWSSETVVKVNEANKIVTVLWDGDKERVDEVDSSYKQLQWLNDEEYAKAVKVAHQTASKLKSLAATIFETIAVTAVKTLLLRMTCIDRMQR